VVGSNRDVDVPGRVYRRIHILVGRAGLVGLGDRDRLGERLSAVTRDRDADLGRAAVIDGPGRVHVVLVAAARDVVDRHPLLVLDEAEAQAEPVGRVLKGLAAVALDPVAPEVVAVGDGDVGVGVQVGPNALNGSVTW